MYVQRVLSVPWGIRQALVVFLLPWVIMPLAVMVWLQVVSPFFPQLQQFLSAFYRGDPLASFSLILLDVAASYVLIGYYLRRYQAGPKDLGLRAFNILKALGNLALIIVVFSVLVNAAYVILTVLSPGFDAAQPQVNEFTSAPGALHGLSLLALVIIPPLVEEPVFRGFMFPAFAKRFGLAGGAVVSSLLFGFAHLQANVSVYTFLLGLLLCFLYVRLGSIIPGTLLHMLNNYIAFSALTK